jgi:hypothetical protein
MSRLSQLAFLPCLVLIAGCGGEPATVPPVIESVAYAQKLADGTYKVQLRYSVTSSGGPCLSKDWFKTWTSYSTNWLYVKALGGVLTADQIVLTDETGKREWPYAETNMQGTVSFTNATMVVRLEKPGYDYKRNVQQGYVPYFLNGAYRIVEKP